MAPKKKLDRIKEILVWLIMSGLPYILFFLTWLDTKKTRYSVMFDILCNSKEILVSLTCWTISWFHWIVKCSVSFIFASSLSFLWQRWLIMLLIKQYRTWNNEIPNPNVINIFIHFYFFSIDSSFTNLLVSTRDAQCRFKTNPAMLPFW